MHGPRLLIDRAYDLRQVLVARWDDQPFVSLLFRARLLATAVLFSNYDGGSKLADITATRAAGRISVCRFGRAPKHSDQDCEI